jgi:hypothetical protein
VKKSFLIFPLVLLFLAGSCYAKTESVEKMFKVMDMEKQFNGGFEAMLPVIDQMSVNFKLDANGKEELRNIYRAWFEEDIDRALVMEKITGLYTDAFSKEDIEEITKFYQTPVGQKLLKKTPELMKLSAHIGMEEAKSKQALLIKRLKPFFEKHKIK